MLNDSKAFSGFSVPDTEAARAFYADTLGLEVTEDERHPHHPRSVAGTAPSPTRSATTSLPASRSSTSRWPTSRPPSTS